jgi:imidazolonepropionase-like amidohydrolase
MGSAVVAGESIERVLRYDAALEASSKDRASEGCGRFLTPGLVEAHAHISWPSSVEKICHQFRLPPDELKEATWRNSRILLDHGFTSAYSAGALSEKTEPLLRDELGSERLGRIQSLTLGGLGVRTPSFSPLNDAPIYL